MNPTQGITNFAQALVSSLMLDTPAAEKTLTKVAGDSLGQAGTNKDKAARLGLELRELFLAQLKYPTPATSFPERALQLLEVGNYSRLNSSGGITHSFFDPSHIPSKDKLVVDVDKEGIITSAKLYESRGLGANPPLANFGKGLQEAHIYELELNETLRQAITASLEKK